MSTEEVIIFLDDFFNIYVQAKQILEGAGQKARETWQNRTEPEREPIEAPKDTMRQNMEKARDYGRGTVPDTSPINTLGTEKSTTGDAKEGAQRMWSDAKGTAATGADMIRDAIGKARDTIQQSTWGKAKRGQIDARDASDQK